jgi:isoleucyl-tRNA synthetase
MENAIEGKDFNFAEQEKAILEFWTKIDAFKQQLKRTEGCKEYVFFDGPPFATGLPHYGHILAGTIKVHYLDSLLRDLSMQRHSAVCEPCSA